MARGSRLRSPWVESGVGPFEGRDLERAWGAIDAGWGVLL